MVNDYYELLDIPHDATAEDVKAAFREKVKEYHPDVSDDPKAARKFQAVHDAREVLTNPKKRQRYDRLGHEGYYGGSSDSDESGSSADDERHGPTTDRATGSGRQEADGETNRDEPAGTRAGSSPDGQRETGSNRRTTSGSDRQTGQAASASASSRGSGRSSTPGGTSARQYTSTAAGGGGDGTAGARWATGGYGTASRTASYPSEPFDDPVQNLVAQAWGVRLGVTASVVAFALGMTWFLARMSAYSVVPGWPADRMAGLLELLAGEPIGFGSILALVAAVFLGYGAAIYGDVPSRENDALVPTDHSVVLTLSIAAFGIGIGAFGMAHGGDPRGFVAAAAVPFGASLLVAIALLFRVVGVEAAAVVGLPPATIVTTVVARPTSLAVPADVIPIESATAPSVGFALSTIMLWALGVGVVRGTVLLSLQAWNLRYRGGYRIQPVIWDLLLVVPVLSLAWFYAGGHSALPISVDAIPFLGGIELHVTRDGTVSRSAVWALAFVAPVLVGAMLYARRGIETLLVKARRRIE